MDETIKQSIEARKNAFINSYEITDETLKKEIEELFNKMNELGKECKDVMEFESKFATSPLSGEYTKLYTKMASTCEMVSLDKMFRGGTSETKDSVVSEQDEIKEKDDLEYVADEAMQPVRRAVKEEIRSKLRDTPLGDIEQVSNTKSLFDKWFKK